MQLDQWLLIIAAFFLLFLFMIDVAKELISKKKQRKADQDKRNDRAFEETFTRLRQETEAKRHDTIYYPSYQTEDYTTTQSQEETNDGSHAADQ